NVGRVALASQCDFWPRSHVLLITVQFKNFLTIAVLGMGVCAAKAGTPVATDVYAKSIQTLGGVVVDPMVFPQTLTGFQAFLTASAVKVVTAAELTQPNHPEVAAKLGFPNFLPQRNWWPRG